MDLGRSERETMNDIRVDHIGASDFVPYDTPAGAEGEVHWIRNAGQDGVDTRTGIWRADERTMPQDLDVVFAGAETIYMIEGELHIVDVRSSETFVLTPGNIASFDRGTPTIWRRISSSIKTLMFIAN